MANPVFTSPNFTVISDGSIEVAGSSYGVPGQVLTSNGAGQPVFWATVTGGGGSGGGVVNASAELLVSLNDDGMPELCFASNDILYATNTN